MHKKLTQFFSLILMVCFAVGYSIALCQEMPACISYAQESMQEVIDNELIEHLLNTSPQLKRLVGRLQEPTRYGAAIPNKILLVGPPGVGKTTVAKGIAKRVNRPYKFLRASLLVNEYKNSGAQNLAREIIPILQKGEPYVIIIDEIHSLTQNHKEKNNPDIGNAEALWSILDECSKCPWVLFIGTTNDVTDLPDPLKSRFTNGIIEIKLPTLEQRERIIRYYLRNVFYSFSDDYIKKLAYQTKTFSGRIIEQMMREALIYALDRDSMPTICQEDCQKALRDINKNQHYLAMIGWEKYQKFFKDNATILIALFGTVSGVAISAISTYWQVKMQEGFQEKQFLSQEKYHDESTLLAHHNSERTTKNQTILHIKTSNAGLELQKDTSQKQIAQTAELSRESSKAQLEQTSIQHQQNMAQTAGFNRAQMQQAAEHHHDIIDLQNQQGNAQRDQQEILHSRGMQQTKELHDDSMKYQKAFNKETLEQSQKNYDDSRQLQIMHHEDNQELQYTFHDDSMNQSSANFESQMQRQDKHNEESLNLQEKSSEKQYALSEKYADKNYELAYNSALWQGAVQGISTIANIYSAVTGGNGGNNGGGSDGSKK